MRVLIVGCGYVGLPLGARLAAEGHEVYGVRRNAYAEPELSTRGIKLLAVDITKPHQLAGVVPDFDAVVNLVSSTRGGVDEYKQVYLEGTRNLLRWLKESPPKKYIYTSSTSVYAQSDGSIVTEESVAAPDSPTSGILRETEQELERAFLSADFPAIALRVAGIYGPERGHLFKQYLRGEAVIRDDGAAYINNVHVEDVAGAIIHIFTAGKPGEIYNLVDNEPVTQLDFFRWLSEKLNKPMPPSAPADPNRKRGLTNKRVSNAKLRATGYSFLYPTFREGYATEIAKVAV